MGTGKGLLRLVFGDAAEKREVTFTVSSETASAVLAKLKEREVQFFCQDAKGEGLWVNLAKVAAVHVESDGY